MLGKGPTGGALDGRTGVVVDGAADGIGGVVVAAVVDGTVVDGRVVGVVWSSVVSAGSPWRRRYR